MASDIPPFLDVGTPVSAKFKGAFCEATIKQIKKNVKCKVLLKEDCRSFIVNHDDLIGDDLIGDIEVNRVVWVKEGDGVLKEGILQRMTDHSVYTVVFDDGDERTLKRTNVCVMGEKHFNEHENLDNLPLTDPENFLTPVLVRSSDKRRKRHKSAAHVEDCEDSDSDKSARPSADSAGLKSTDQTIQPEKEFIGKVVCIEQGERKKSWFPALGLKNVGLKVIPLNDICPSEQVFVQSFKDGKKMYVHKDDVKEFHKDKEPLASYFKGELKIEPILRASIDKALAYNDFGELPKGWNILDTIDEKDSSDEDSLLMPGASSPKRFSEMISDFMARQGSPISKPPVTNNQPVDLLRLYECVAEYGCSDDVTNQQWRNIYTKLGLQNIHSAVAVSLKYLYKKYLGPYEAYVKKYGKSSPRRLGRLGRRAAQKKQVKEEGEGSSVRSESDSEESERKRATRSNKSAEKTTNGIPIKKCRPGPSETLVNDLSCAGGNNEKQRDFSEHEIFNKSEGDEAEVVNSPHSSLTSEDNDNRIVIAEGKPQVGKYKPGTRIAVHYGSGANHRLYNAKILDVEREKNGEVVYYVHYNGWNHRYDEWIKEQRIHGLSSNTPSKRKNGQPPTPLSRIRKDPPKKFQSQMDSNSLHLHPPAKRTISEVYASRMSSSKHHIPDKPSSSSPRRSPIYISERISDLNKAKQAHRPKPVNETLFIPDIKPSPVKPRMTRNSMQDMALLNALEESIGKPTNNNNNSNNNNNINIGKPTNQLTSKSPAHTFTSAVNNLQQDILLKTEPPTKKPRPNDSFPKSESDFSSKDEKESTECHSSTTKKNKSKFIKRCLADFDADDEKKALSSFDPKESSKTETVKKWIEDSNKILSKSKSEENHIVIKKEEDEESREVDVMLTDDEMSKQGDESGRTKKSEDDSLMECDTIKDEPITDVCSDSNQNSCDLIKEESCSSPPHMLNDFCNIIDNVQKLKPTNVKHEDASPTKENNKSPRKHHKKLDKSKCKMGHSGESSYKGPTSSKKEKRSEPLEYDIDFMSDLSSLLVDKDATQRILIMQTKMNAMRTLYCKLKTEVANIDRRRRRKLRKQAERQRKDST